MKTVKFSDLLNKTLTEIKLISGKEEKILSSEELEDNLRDYFIDEIIFSCENEKFRLFNDNNRRCDVSILLDEVHGDLNDLVNSPLTIAEKVSQKGKNTNNDTWTFYKLATIKGYVTLKFIGVSNGYYSEKSTFEKVETGMNAK